MSTPGLDGISTRLSPSAPDTDGGFSGGTSLSGSAG